MVEDRADRALNNGITGYLPQVKSSRPAQSVASLNINYDDSESIVRAYKKKKLECEQLRDQCVSLET